MYQRLQDVNPEDVADTESQSLLQADDAIPSRSGVAAKPADNAMTKLLLCEFFRAFEDVHPLSYKSFVYYRLYTIRHDVFAL